MSHTIKELQSTLSEWEELQTEEADNWDRK